MKIIKYNANTIVKLILNHTVSAVYSLMLLLICKSFADGKFELAGSILSIFFYLGLIYSFMWHAGAKDANSYYRKEISAFSGAFVIIAGTLPAIVTNVAACIFSIFKSDAEFAERTVDTLYQIFYFFNSLFVQCMYTGFFDTLKDNVSSIPAYWYLLSLIPALIVGTLAYALGYKSFRLRTLIGIKYDEEKEKIKNNY